MRVKRDSKGFRVYWRSGRLFLQFARNANVSGWAARLQVGPGAGVRWLDLPGHSMNAAHPLRSRLYVPGFTLYAARDAGSLRWACTYRGARRPIAGLQVGITRNANVVPYASH